MNSPSYLERNKEVTIFYSYLGVCISWFPALAPNLCLAALAPNLYLAVLAYSFITSPGPEFACTNLVSSICICIYSPGL